MNACMLPCWGAWSHVLQSGPHLGHAAWVATSAITVMKFVIVFEQRDPRFQFALSPRKLCSWSCLHSVFNFRSIPLPLHIKLIVLKRHPWCVPGCELPTACQQLWCDDPFISAWWIAYFPNSTRVLFLVVNWPCHRRLIRTGFPWSSLKSWKESYGQKAQGSFGSQNIQEEEMKRQRDELFEFNTTASYLVWW